MCSPRRRAARWLPHSDWAVACCYGVLGGCLGGWCGALGGCCDVLGGWFGILGHDMEFWVVAKVVGVFLVARAINMSGCCVFRVVVRAVVMAS